MFSRAIRRFATGLTVFVLLSSSAAQAERQGGWPVRQARTADHFRFSGDYDTLVKVPHPAEWRDGKLFVVDHQDRVHFAEATRHIASKLRGSSAFTERFGSVIPTVKIENGSWIAQGSRSGSSFRDLSESKQERALEEMTAAVEMASEITGTKVDADPSRFSFDHKGRISGWYAAPPAPAGKAVDFKLVSTIGEGANARAYEVKSSDARLKRFRVLKVLKAYAPRRTPEEAPIDVLAALSTEAEYLAKAFAEDKAFADHFGDIIPKTIAIAPGVIAQEMAEGRRFDSLDTSAQERAREEIKTLREMGKRIAPGVVITGRTQNYLFHKDGRIASFYDIASDGHKAYIKAGLKERVFAHKQAQDTN